MQIRRIENKDHEAIWRILRTVNASGDAFAFSPQMGKEEMLAWWLASDKHTYVFEENEEVLGTFYLKDNQPGLGSRIRAFPSTYEKWQLSRG